MRATIAYWFQFYHMLILEWEVQEKWRYETLHIYATDRLTGNKHEFYF